MFSESRSPLSANEMACSDWTLSWVGSVVLRGYEGDETNRFLPSKLKSKSIRDKAIASWEEERSTKEKPCLWKVFLGLIKFELIVGVIFGLLQGLLATVARPLLLKFCVDGLIDERADSNTTCSRSERSRY